VGECVPCQQVTELVLVTWLGNSQHGNERSSDPQHQYYDQQYRKSSTASNLVKNSFDTRRDFDFLPRSLREDPPQDGKEEGQFNDRKQPEGYARVDMQHEKPAARKAERIWRAGNAGERPDLNA
jgi:hypothetical protein